MVFYFSGTGNSKSVANIIANGLKCDICSINEHLQQNKPYTGSDDILIFVAPVYSWRLPKIVQNWIKQNIPTLNQKVYFVLTCGDDIGNADLYIEKFCKKQGFVYMGTTEVIMPENYLVMFEPPTPEESLPIIECGENSVKEIIELIKENKTIAKKKKSTFADKVKSGFVNDCFNVFYVSAKKFKSLDSCISCGKCQKVCPLNNIELVNGKPVWGRKCTHCMACICSCPPLAIEYGKNSKNKNRYLHPNEK